MDLYLEIIDGPQKGNRSPLRPGLTLGRKACDVTIEDPKISGRHAQIEQRADGQFWLLDLGSSNGIRSDGQKVTELALEIGSSFRLGRTRFRIRSSSDQGGMTDVKNVIAGNGAENKAGTRWRDKILALSERVIREVPMTKKRDVSMIPLAEPAKLMFTRGLQSGTEWTIGYGPRESGASSVDLPLFEPGLPAKCFRLVPQAKDLIIRVHEEALGKILLNGKRVETSFLKSRDVLDIGNTRIEIVFGD